MMGHNICFHGSNEGSQHIFNETVLMMGHNICFR